MTSARRVHHTCEDDVRFERESATKHEYCDGEIDAMAGGTPTPGTDPVLVAEVTSPSTEGSPAPSTAPARR